MSEEEVPEGEEPKKSSKLPLIIGLVLAIGGGGGGFFAVYSGMILGGESHEEAAAVEEEEPAPDMPDVAFLPVEQMVISLGTHSDNRHLRFKAQLEVPSKYQSDVQILMPRVVDVLNGYLRALETSDLEDPSMLTKLRAQMLRRVQIVTGQGRVRDLLIMEFVLN